MATPRGATKIGSNYYLFKSSGGGSECLISAHGGHARERHFTVPSGVTVHFYALHGFTLQDPGVALLNLKVKPKETVNGGQRCHNYALSKYQGSHNRAGETYASIDQTITDTMAARTAAVHKHAELSGANAPAFRLEMAMNKINSYNPIHIVTVRNRIRSGDMYLDDLIRKVRQSEPGITVFHCSFCRSSMHFDAGMSQRATTPLDSIV